MNKVYLSAEVSEDGSLTIPAFAARGLGYEPGETVHMTLPVQSCICDCDDNELFLSRCCGESECSGYRSDDDELNIPPSLLCEAGIPVGTNVSVLAADGALVLIAAEDTLEDLPLELRCFLSELGINTHSLYQAPGIFHHWKDEQNV
ncbi:hypothetical protein LJC60_04065 [Ruminococcaceae bacterium OttesenSCG-928-D13]|nr:hypothetical protein [Ruminococcaceae bacterium OttesenSCG-928-D13]